MVASIVRCNDGRNPYMYICIIIVTVDSYLFKVHQWVGSCMSEDPCARQVVLC